MLMKLTLLFFPWSHECLWSCTAQDQVIHSGIWKCKLSSFAPLSKPCVPEPWLLHCFCASRDSVYAGEVLRKWAETVLQIFAQLKYERRTRAKVWSFLWSSQGSAPEQYCVITLHRNSMKAYHRLLWKFSYHSCFTGAKSQNADSLHCSFSFHSTRWGMFQWCDQIIDAKPKWVLLRPSLFVLYFAPKTQLTHINMVLTLLCKDILKGCLLKQRYQPIQSFCPFNISHISSCVAFGSFIL